jgi:hypothetical protein
VLEVLRTGEENFGLVGEIAEERPCGDAGMIGDLRHRRLFVSDGREQLQRGRA